MTIKAAEVGKTVVCYCAYGLSAATSMEIDIIDAAGAAVTTVITSRITAPASPYVDATLGTLAASEYMQFTTLATDFPAAGVYTLLPVYNDTGATQIFYADAAEITIEARDNV